MRRHGAASGARTSLALLALLLGIASFTASAEETVWFFGGTVTTSAMALGSGAGSVLPDSWAWASSTGLSASLGVRGQRTRAEASFDAAALGGGAAARALAAAALPDSGILAAGSSEEALSLGLRTLWARIDLGGASLQAGRQVINYGRGALWSPIDLFARLDLSGTTTQRLGRDAIRLRLPLGDLSGLDLVAAPATEPGKGLYAARVSGLVAGLDGGILVAWKGGAGEVAAGADLGFDLGPGFYGEALWTGRPGSLEAARIPEGLRAVAGGNWSLGPALMAIEYYFNGGGGAADPAFPGRHYLRTAASWKSGDFIRAAGSLVLDLAALVAEGTGGAPARAQVSLAVDSSQNSELGVYLDASRGSFAAAGPKGRSLALGCLLRIRF